MSQGSRPTDRRFALTILAGCIAGLAAGAVFLIQEGDSAPPSAPHPSTPRARESRAAASSVALDIARGAAMGQAPNAPAARHPAPSAEEPAPGAEARRFVDEGWTLVTATPPDRRVAALDPALLPSREEALRSQLETSPLRDELVERALQIHRGAQDPRTRRAVVDALARTESAGAQGALRGLAERTTDDTERRVLFARIRPASLDDPGAEWLAARAASPDLPDALRETAAFSLAFAALAEAERTGAPSPRERVLQRCPEAARELVASALDRIVAGARR